MNVDRFAALLRNTMGLDIASIGSAALERAVGVRAGDRHVEAYWAQINAEPAELQALIDEIVVSETWFLRDREAFAALGRAAVERLARFNLNGFPTRPLRLLSLPCSSGEEPYSMAISLFDANLKASQFTIDAFDVSTRAIAHARQAVYGRNSFRGGPLDFRDRYFSESGRGWALDARVRETVRFECANLFELPAELACAPYDFVFCRNVLIYFDRETQARAVGVLDGLLADDGMLFVGPSETGLLMLHGFTPAKIPMAFAFYRTPPHVAPPPAAMRYSAPAPRSGHRGETTPKARAVGAPAAPLVKPSPAASASVRPAAASPSARLQPAATLADAGDFAAARQAVEVELAQHGPSAAAFYLLGLLADAERHETEARNYYRKTLYLEPMHHQALTHLAALLDMAGDRAGAKLLSQRAARAAEKPRD